MIDTGKAVLIDVFMMGIYDARWKDISADRGSVAQVLGIERRILTNAASRATQAATPP